MQAITQHEYIAAIIDPKLEQWRYTQDWGCNIDTLVDAKHPQQFDRPHTEAVWCHWNYTIRAPIRTYPSVKQEARTQQPYEL
ncbi:hypothetical protein QE152_g5615 [Popillia japonica]|uniref:Uncharacterized protein n=1 Tax=Popillia japonica TaxID=7064 RepID=A0AAW1MMM2_POPJA